MHAERRTTVYTKSLESRSEIDPQPVAFQDEIFIRLMSKHRKRRSHQEEILCLRKKKLLCSI